MNKLEKLHMIVTIMWAIGLFAVGITHAHVFYTSHNHYHLFSSILYTVCSFVLGYVLYSLYNGFKSNI